MTVERIHDRMIGRWKSLLPQVGMAHSFLTGRHGACPMCGGKDRFRFDDKGGCGTWFCSHCGAGNGVDLVMKFKDTNFLGAVREIERHIGAAQVIAPKATKSDAARIDQARDQMTALWQRSRPLDGTDIASRYLAGRGIVLKEWPVFLRVIDDLPHWNDDKTKTIHPAMLAKFAAHDGKSSILHRTYLSEPGKKAALLKPRMLMPGRVPDGGAVRLFPAAETLGIAEGIETALSAAILFGVPVWSALTAGSLVKWKPPPETKCVLIFGDSDKSLAGQYAAYSLGYRLRSQGVHAEIRLPDEEGTDWNDVLSSAAPQLALVHSE